MLACRPGVKTYGNDLAQDFHEGTVVVVATFVEETVNANSSLVY